MQATYRADTRLLFLRSTSRAGRCGTCLCLERQVEAQHAGTQNIFLRVRISDHENSRHARLHIGIYLDCSVAFATQL